MNLKAVIVDDERLARKELRSLLVDFEEISVIGEAKNLTEACKLIEVGRPDVVFLDIQLRNENGFDLLKQIEQNFKLIFVTAFDEFAIRAFEINALDYLLKPVNPKRLRNAIERLFVEEHEEKQTELRKLEIDDRIFVEVNERSYFLQIADISHIKASGDYTEVYKTDGKRTLIEKPLKEWDLRLPEKHFTRIHRSTIININRIEKIETLFNRTMEVRLKNSDEGLSVSRRYTAKLKEKFG
ncbi:MAG: response regulator transcription factor [Pyrinomonadaceae bacterium]|nr:response regulator transcription factor [Pyrinomonadaceae bacterium]